MPDHVVIETSFPEAPGLTRVRCDWLFPAPVIADPGFDPSDAVEIFDLVNRQDWEVCEMAQQGMGSKAYRQGGVYSPVESDLFAFSQFIRQRLATDPV